MQKTKLKIALKKALRAQIRLTKNRIEILNELRRSYGDVLAAIDVMQVAEKCSVPKARRLV